MSLKDAIANFIVSHSSLLQQVEKMALQELVTVLKSLYPNDVVLQTIVQKVSDEILKLQGLDASS